MQPGDAHSPQYTGDQASAYGAIGIDQTTYQIGFDAVAGLLGELDGQTFLDFGSGAGRSAQLLRHLGARAVHGVDHNIEMIKAARGLRIPGVHFHHVKGRLPFRGEAFDGALSANVFVELRTQRRMVEVCCEIARVVKPGGCFVLMTASPQAFGHEFRSFAYAEPKSRESGCTAVCTIHTPHGSIEVLDTYWTEDDCRVAIEQSTLRLTDVVYPVPSYVQSWPTSEPSIAPFVVMKAIKPLA